MRIKRLELENFRGFKKAAVDFPKGNVAVFFGWNGAGKTAVLDAVAITLSTIIDEKYEYGVYQNDDDILKGEENTTLDATYSNNNSAEYKIVSRLKLGGKPQISVTGLQDLFDRTRKLDENLPVIVYYKTQREIRPQNSKKFKHTKGRLFAYIKAIDAEVNDFNDFVEWFSNEQGAENDQKVEKGKLDWENPSLYAIRRGISIFLSEMDANFSGLKVRRQSNEDLDINAPSHKPVLFIQKKGQELKLSQLSSGERTLIMLAVDILRRAVILNPQMPDPLQSSGVVLIDEIELHLHPKWQRAAIPALKATFPNIQFIIATHSPQVLSEVENGAVFEIENFQIHTRNTYGRDNNWQLHVIMEDHERPEEVQQDLEEYFKLLRDGDLDKAARLRQQIEEKIGTDEPELVKADILLRRKERALAS